MGLGKKRRGGCGSGRSGGFSARLRVTGKEGLVVLVRKTEVTFNLAGAQQGKVGSGMRHSKGQ